MKTCLIESSQNLNDCVEDYSQAFNSMTPPLKQKLIESENSITTAWYDVEDVETFSMSIL